MARRFLPALLLACLACGKGDALPDDLPGLKQTAVQARDEALAARGERDPKKAQNAAELARRADEHAGALLKAKADATPADRELATDIHRTAREAVRLSRLTTEEKTLHDRTTGLKAKAYRAGRTTALAGAFQGLALAADQEAKGGQVPKGVHESAVAGADVAEIFSGRKATADGTTDWAGVASDLRGLASSTPPEMSTFFALALVVSRQDGLALIEIESVDAKAIKSPEHLAGHLLLRGIIFRLNGLPESAGDSIRAAGGGPDSKIAMLSGQELQAGLHLAMAATEIHDQNFEAADIEIVRAMKAWPNNPIAVFMTGERLGAMGEREAAARSLESSLAGNDQEWIAKRIAARARELRDGQGPAEPLLYDGALLRDVALWHVWQAAKTSAPARSLQKKIEAARVFAARWTPGSE